MWKLAIQNSDTVYSLGSILEGIEMCIYAFPVKSSKYGSILEGIEICSSRLCGSNERE